MKKLLLMLALFTFTALPAFANHDGTAHENLKTITVTVNGLVCDFCARAVEKVLYREDGVEGVNVNLDDHIVTVQTSETANLSDETLTKLITDAGYNVVEITRE